MSIQSEVHYEYNVLGDVNDRLRPHVSAAKDLASVHLAEARQYIAMARFRIAQVIETGDNMAEQAS